MDILERIPFNYGQAVVFDIDDTLITSDTNEIMSKTFNLFKYCVNKGYHVYIITARINTQRVINFTLQQLSSLGITGYKLIAFRDPNDLNVARYKMNARRVIPQDIIMSVGDQEWDIGPYGGIGIIVRR